LIALGHTDIAFVGSTPPTDAPARDVDERSIGYRNAMTDSGLAVRIRSVPSTLTITDAYAAAASFLADAASRPTGVVAACDEVAVGVMIAARRMGISVPTAEMFALTTIEQYPGAQGVEATRLLLSMLEGEQPPPRTTADTRLVVRASTAPPRTL
jgi:DNA-binding LacI/PurR family transcriptional regulator